MKKISKARTLPFLTKKICLLFAISLLAVAGHSQNQQLTLDSIRSMALRHNRQAAIAKEAVNQYDHTVKSVRANFFPKLSLSGIYAYSDNISTMSITGGYLPAFTYSSMLNQYFPSIIGYTADGTPIFSSYAYMPDIDLELKIGSVYRASAELKQPIYMGGKIRAGLKMAKIGKDIAEMNVKLTDSEILLQSEEAYWNCIRAKEMLQVAEKYKEVVDEFVRNMGNAVESGMKPKNDLLKVQVKQNDADLNILKANNAVRLATMNLCYVVGLPMKSKVDIVENENDSIIMPLTGNEYDMEKRIEIQMLEKQVAMKEQEVKAARSEFLPQIGASASYGYANGVELNDIKLIDGGSFLGLVSVSIPVFQWGEGYHKIKAAEAEKKIAELSQEDLRLKMELEIQQAYNAYTEAMLEYSHAVKAVQQAEANMNVSRDYYEAGMETLAEYLESQTVWQQNMGIMVDAKASLNQNKTRYLKVTGNL